MAGDVKRPGTSNRAHHSRRRARGWKRYRKLISFIGTVVGVILAIVLLCVLLIPDNDKTKSGDRSDKDVVMDYIADPNKDYSADEKIAIVTAYKNLLETDGEDAVDAFMTQDEQNAISLMGMSVNEYVFRDFKNHAYLNSDNSFINVEGYKTIAGFDVDASIGADGYANLESVEIIIDDQLCTVANLQAEIESFFERFEQANAIEKTATIYGVDAVDVDENTRLYITYLDVQYDNNQNVTALRVSGHLLTR